MSKFLKLGKGLLISPLLALLVACDGEQPTDTTIGAQGNTPATSATIMANAKVREDLNLGDQTDFEDARRGLIAVPTALEVAGPGDSIVWDMPSYDFIQGEAPDTVNPSLWRQATLNNNHGLFEVTDGVYQLRGFDLSNMSIIEGANRVDHRRSTDLQGNRCCGNCFCQRTPWEQASFSDNFHPLPHRPLRRRAVRSGR